MMLLSLVMATVLCALGVYAEERKWRLEAAICYIAAILWILNFFLRAVTIS